MQDDDADVYTPAPNKSNRSLILLGIFLIKSEACDKCCWVLLESELDVVSRPSRRRYNHDGDVARRIIRTRNTLFLVQIAKNLFTCVGTSRLLYTFALHLSEMGPPWLSNDTLSL